MAIGAALAAAVGLFVVPALGLFTMSATGSPGFLDWWGDTNWEQSLDWRAPELTAPPTADASRGLRHFRAMCMECHGAPSGSREAWAEHMQPRPPDLWESSTQARGDGELHYIITNGVRMTAMPAFGAMASDDEVWDLVAAVKQLDSLTDAQRDFLASGEEGESGEASHEGG